MVPAEMERGGGVVEHEEGAAALAPEGVEAGVVGTAELEAAVPTDAGDERAAAGAVGRAGDGRMAADDAVHAIGSGNGLV